MIADNFEGGFVDAEGNPVKLFWVQLDGHTVGAALLEENGTIHVSVEDGPEEEYITMHVDDWVKQHEQAGKRYTRKART